MPIIVSSHHLNNSTYFSSNKSNKAVLSFSDSRYSNESNIVVDSNISENDLEKISSLTQHITPFVSNSPIIGDSGILPPGLLYVTKNYLVFEKPPCYQNIFLISNQVSEINYAVHEPVLYRLPIPWQLYIVAYSQEHNYENQNSLPRLVTANVRMHFMDGPLLSLDQKMYMAPLNNFYTSGDLCRPMFDSMDDLERYSKDLSGVMQSAYDWIWNSGANLDLTDAVVNHFIQFVKNTTTSVFTEYNPCPYYNRSSYYCTPNHVEYFYSLWEKIPLHEVSQLSWPANSRSTRFRQDEQNVINTRLAEYLRENNLYHFNDEYCDECAQYPETEDGDYDYDSEPYHYDECECSCHSSLNYDTEHFLSWAGVLPPQPVTFSESFKNFVIDTKLSNPAYKGMRSSYLLQDSYRGRYLNIIDQVLLNS